MKYVEIYKLQKDGSQIVLANGKLVDDVVVVEGDEKFVNFVTNEGITNYTEGSKGKLFPKDGLLFLEQLQENFRSDYLYASDIKEG